MSGRSTVLCQPPGPPPRRYLLLKLRETAEGREKAEGRPPPPAERARESPAPARERGSKKERAAVWREGERETEGGPVMGYSTQVMYACRHGRKEACVKGTMSKIAPKFIERSLGGDFIQSARDIVRK